LGIYGGIAIALMILVIWSREKWIGVKDFKKDGDENKSTKK